MNTASKRIVICAKDIELITGKCERTARRMLAAIKKQHEKPTASLVTIAEFCNYTGLKQHDIAEYIK